MALNGLDSQLVNEAFQTAISEPGGWFLLKYISRDEVDVLARGNGGVADLREAVAGYSELSPLYGFLRFRRRSVVVRYVPNDTSRLIQARVKVHFQPVMEKFSPHDAIFAISEAAELKETSLSAACSLHAASGSTSSTTSSVRRRRLGEIAEDVEESPTSTSDSHKALPPLPYEQAKMGEPPVSEISRPDAKLVPTTAEVKDSIQTRPSSSKASSHEADVPFLTSQTLSTAPGHITSSSLKANQDLDVSFGVNRPTSQGMYHPSTFAVTPKIKLGPRPLIQVSKRPHTSSSVPRQNERRPVSTLPAGIRIAPRRNQTIEIPSKHQAQSQLSRFPISIPVTPTRISDHPISSTSPSLRPLTSPGPASPGSTASSASTVKAETRTPEKERLMKALEIRRKQMSLQTQQSASSSLAGKERNSGSLVNNNEQIRQISQVQQEYPRQDLGMNDASDLATRDNAKIDCISPRAECGMILTTQNLKGLTPSAAEDEPLEFREEPSQEPSSDSDFSHRESIDTPDTTGEREVYIDYGKEGMTDTAVQLDGLAKDDATKRSYAADESEGDRGHLVPNMNCSPVSSNNSTELPSTQASSFSEETYHRPPISTEEQQGSGIEHESTLAKLTLDPYQIGLSSTGTPFQGAEPSNQMLPKNGTSPTTIVSCPLVGYQMTQAPARQEMSVGSDHADASTSQNMGNLRLTADLLSKHDADGIVSSEIQGLLKCVRQGSSISLETAPCGAESPGSASIDVIQSHSKQQRCPHVDPIHTDVSADNSDDNLLSDDSLMDELHSATVQEAKPVSLGRSPIMSTFPRSRDPLKQNRTVLAHRVVSSPASGSESTAQSRASALPVSADSLTRSSSASFLCDDREKGTISLIKKVSVSSGISQRIKALERVSSQSSRLALPPPSASATKTTSPSFPALRKINLRSTPKSNAASKDRTRTLNGAGISAHKSTLQPTQDPKSTPSTSFSIQVGEPVQQHHGADTSIKEQLNHDITLSHTQSNPLNRRPGDLLGFQNTTVIERHDVPSQVTLPTNESIKAEELPLLPSPPYPSQISNSSSPIQSRRPSLASAGSSSSSSHDRSQSISHRLSSDSSAGGKANVEGGRESKRNSNRESRKSRLFRRLSLISNSSRRSLINALSSAVKEEEPAAVPHSTEERKRISVEIGDINVQFPDNLLWKRRCMKLDSKGYIALTGSRIDEKSRTSAKSYHISEFTRPFAPDLDMQEMPNSVVLAFRHGSSLQCACESAAGQAQVLSVLKDSYDYWVEQ